MKITRRELLAGTSASLLVGQEAERLALWYKTPAGKWTDALPIGNGRLGAMIFGGVQEERLQLNEDTLWSGAPRAWNNPAAKTHLGEVRQLVLEKRDYVAADRACHSMQGPYNESYLPLADLHITMDHSADVTGYRRELDLDTAISRVSYRIDGAEYVREAFSAFPAQVLVLRLTTTNPGGMALTLALDSPLHSSSIADSGMLRVTGKAPAHVEPNYVRSDNAVVYDDAEGKGMRFEAAASVTTEGGSITPEGARLRIQNARSVTVRIAARTGY